MYQPHPDHYWTHLDHLPTIYRPHLDHVPSIYWPHLDQVPSIYRPHLDHVPSIYWTHLDQVPTIYRPHSDHVPTNQSAPWSRAPHLLGFRELDPEPLFLRLGRLQRVLQLRPVLAGVQQVFIPLLFHGRLKVLELLQPFRFLVPETWAVYLVTRSKACGYRCQYLVFVWFCSSRVPRMLTRNKLRRVIFSKIKQDWHYASKFMTRLALCQYTWPQYMCIGVRIISTKTAPDKFVMILCTFVCDTSGSKLR